jgi:DNA N-6-adenine-methyltransferase (Dam)
LKPKLLPHPIANCWPLIEGEEFSELVRDIKQNGILTPIWIYQGKILDGRNRYKASLKAGVSCPQKIYKGNDPFGFAHSLNTTRRHLSTSQRAMTAAKIANLAQGTRKDLNAKVGKFAESLSQPQAAQLLKISTRSVGIAKKILKEARSEIVAAVESGTMSLNEAAKYLQPSSAEQKKLSAGVWEKQKPIYALNKNQKLNELYTPPRILDKVRDVFGGSIDLDPCSCAIAQKNVKAHQYFSQSQNGLAQKWTGKVWINPPFSGGELVKWIDTILKKWSAHEAREIILLVPSYTETQNYQRLLAFASAVCFVKGRVKFLGGVGMYAVTGTSIFYFGTASKRKKFIKSFSDLGVTLPIDHI